MSLGRMHRRGIVAASLGLAVGKLALADQWPQWRGAAHNGISGEKDIPAEFGPGNHEVWKLPLPGAAGSTPVVWDERIFLTTVNGDQLELWCVSTAGKVAWKQTVSQGNQDVRGDEGNAASPSPCTDGKHVWANFANGALACYTADAGQEVWKLDLQKEFGQFKIQFGMTSTPLLDEGRPSYI